MTFRQHTTNLVDASHDGQALQLCGWVHRYRDHGGVIFIDLRDAQGCCQLVVNPDDAGLFALAEGCRSEFVIRVEGICRKRPEGTENQSLTTGDYELNVTALAIMNKSLPLPFAVDEQVAMQSGEDVRLHYRFLDMRRNEVKSMLQKRAQVFSVLRRYLESQDFLEIETPVLTKPTPEGAREYLVPSRTQSGYGFALQQSPQQSR